MKSLWVVSVLAVAAVAVVMLLAQQEESAADELNASLEAAGRSVIERVSSVD